MRFLKEDTCLLIIDVQERLFPHIYDNDFLEKNINILIQGVKNLDIPILFTEQYKKGLGETIKSIKDNFVWEFQPIEKMAFSCVDELNFIKQLGTLNKKNVIIAGIETHVCVLQTAIDLKALSYNVMVIKDCVSSRKISDKSTAINRLKQEGVLIGSYESILLELCRESGTDTFKSISKLIK